MKRVLLVQLVNREQLALKVLEDSRVILVLKGKKEKKVNKD